MILTKEQLLISVHGLDHEISLLAIILGQSKELSTRRLDGTHN